MAEEYVCRNCSPPRKYANFLQYMEHLREDSLLAVREFFDRVALPPENNPNVDVGPIDPDLDRLYAVAVRMARLRLLAKELQSR